MLGNAVYQYLSLQKLEVIASFRSGSSVIHKNKIEFDVLSSNLDSFFSHLGSLDFVINCIGVIPQKNKFQDSTRSRQMIEINSLFPHKIAAASDKFDFRVIQIATDCVFSGLSGNYFEDSAHDASDVYGITKSLGEVNHANVMHIRSSIIGRWDQSNVSLNNWLVNQPRNARVKGYSNHLWNGVTTQAFAKVISGIITKGNFHNGISHLIPADVLSKEDLLCLISKYAGRNDIEIQPFKTETPVDRSLGTRNLSLNHELWSAAGYHQAPRISELVKEIYPLGAEGIQNE